MQEEQEVQALRAAILALEGQRATLGDAPTDLAVAALRARLAALLQPAGLQRRRVTVLFADVVGSTAMAGRMDAEDTLDVLGTALRRMADIVEAHQGRVLRFTGDGVKAVFGMTEAREDDPERAVRAGLAILQAGRELAAAAQAGLGVTDFAVRAGVHTGDVALGAGVEADNTAMGAAVNIAARMEQNAPPGALRISHDTWSHVRGLFDVVPQPPLSVKGVDAPMQTYLVGAARDRRLADVERGLQGVHTPMIGRRAELQRLLDAVARARGSARLEGLTLVADAGIGKSRMLRELVARLQGCTVLTVRAQPDGQLRPYGLLRSVLAAQFGVADTDGAETARRKLVDGLAPWFDDGDGERRAALLGQLAGLPFGDSPHLRELSPRSRRDQAFAACADYLRAFGRRGGALPVLVVEDLHWADDGSLDLLQHLLQHATELPAALLMATRPALLARRPDWSPAETLVPLGPLADDERDALAGALLQRLETVPAALTALVVERAEGNPYYMEELVRRLVDDGVIVVDEPHWRLQADRLVDLRLPGTLVGLLQARLDALPADERRAARQASVIGHVFWDDALAAVDAGAPQALPALQQAAFVRAHERSDFEGTTERQFDHHLLHQVIYDTLLKAERRLGHGAVARWLVERTQGRGAEFLALTGEHAERAGETALAIDCFEQASQEAERRFANGAAIAWTRRALGLLGEAEPARRIKLLMRLEKVADTLGDRAAQDARNAEIAALLERHPDDALQAEFLVGLAMLAERRDDIMASERLSHEALALAERCGAAQWAAMSQANLAWLRFVRQDYDSARALVDASLVWAERIEAEAVRAETRGQMLTVSAMISTEQGRFDQALETLRGVLALGQAMRLGRLQLGALDGLARAAAVLGRWDEVADWGRQAAQLSRDIGAAGEAGLAACHLGQATMARGDHAAAIELHERLLSTLRDDASPNLRAGVLQRLGVSHLEQGDAAAAQPWLDRAAQIYRTIDEPIAAGLTDAYAALCEARLGRPAAALPMVNALLERLDGDLPRRSAHEAIELRWICLRVLDELRDARAPGLLVQLHADVQSRADAIAVAGDRARLIEALPAWRAVVAAYERRGAVAGRGAL